MSDNYYKALGEIVKLTHENTELREELAQTKKIAITEILALNYVVDMQAKDLSTAEDRNVELIELLREAYRSGDRDVFGSDLEDRLEAALNKPEEAKV